jgi:hypothetical protein
LDKRTSKIANKKIIWVGSVMFSGQTL